MDEKEEKRIRALELKHKEAMTFIHTFSWITFTFVVALCVIPLSISASGGEMTQLDLGLITLIVAILSIIGAKAFVKLKNDAKVIRDQIYKLEENEMKEDKIKS